MRSDTQIELWHAYRRRGMLPAFHVPSWLAITALGAAMLFMFSMMAGCSRSMRVEDQAAIVRLGARIDKAQLAGCLTPEEAIAAAADLVQLGASLADVERARLLEKAWDTAQPIITAGISILIGKMGA